MVSATTYLSRREAGKRMLVGSLLVPLPQPPPSPHHTAPFSPDMSLAWLSPVIQLSWVSWNQLWW